MDDTMTTMTLPGAAVQLDDGPAVRGTLVREQEIITVESRVATRPDLSWTHIDPAGHFHAYTTAGGLPTLEARNLHIECNGEHVAGYVPAGGPCEGYDVVEHFCLICKAPVLPRRVPDPGPTFGPGAASWHVDVDQQVTAARVTVRVTHDRYIYFGVAQVGVPRANNGPGGLRVMTRLWGAGQLGVTDRLPALAHWPEVAAGS